MREFPWNLPLLRRLSPQQRGLAAAVAVVVVISALVFPAVSRFVHEPSATLCGNLAQIGATLLVAYALEMSWVLKISRRRSRGRENWVGVVSGFGLCALAGIGVALGLEDHAGFGTFAQLAFSWSAASIGFLGALIAVIPVLVHEWTHTLTVEYSDE
jgi:hypothetical protein